MITRVLYSDWEQIFKDDKLLTEGHSVSAAELLRALHLQVEDIDLSVLPNDNHETDNVAAQRSLAAVRNALANQEDR